MLGIETDYHAIPWSIIAVVLGITEFTFADFKWFHLLWRLTGIYWPVG